MKELKRILNNSLLYTFSVILSWCALSAFIQGVKCPEMTQMELLVNIPNSATLNWIDCNKEEE